MPQDYLETVRALHRVQAVVLMMLLVALLVRFRRSKNSGVSKSYLRYWIYAVFAWAIWYSMKGFFGLLLDIDSFNKIVLDCCFNNVTSVFIFLSAYELAHIESLTPSIKRELRDVVPMILLAVMFTYALSKGLSLTFPNSSRSSSIVTFPEAISSAFILLYFSIRLLSRVRDMRLSKIIFICFTAYAILQLLYFHLFMSGYPEVLMTLAFMTAMCLKVICSALAFISFDKLAPATVPALPF